KDQRGQFSDSLVEFALHIFLPLLISILAMYSFLVLGSYDICQRHVYMACRINVALTQSSFLPVLEIVKIVTMLSCAFGCLAIGLYLVSHIIDLIHDMTQKAHKQANLKYIYRYLLALIVVSAIFVYVMYGILHQ
ncbi:MAG: hypothetical protein Q8Q33_07665, partial [Chlamydiota bacterium]|nr:hypothetical protein [Chlamydiota bacterium]